MIKFLDKLRKKYENIKKYIKEIDAYDRVYCNGKIFSLVVVILSLLVIGCFILGFLVFG